MNTEAQRTPPIGPATAIMLAHEEFARREDAEILSGVKEWKDIRARMRLEGCANDLPDQMFALQGKIARCAPFGFQGAAKLLDMAADIVGEQMRSRDTIYGDGPVFELISRVLGQLNYESGPIAEEQREHVERQAMGEATRGESDHPDAELLALEAEFHKIEDAGLAADEAGDEQAEQAVKERWNEVVGRIAAVPAHTADGVAVKVRFLLLSATEGDTPYDKQLGTTALEALARLGRQSLRGGRGC